MINGFHIELTNICTLKCSGCARTQFINIFPQHWKNHNINVNSLMNFLDCDLTNIDIILCGNYGDPIYHPDFHNIISQFKSRGAILKIVTNGSYKNKQWWEQTVEILTAQDTITFSVDGLPENFTTYRVNADWKSTSYRRGESINGLAGRNRTQSLVISGYFTHLWKSTLQFARHNCWQHMLLNAKIIARNN